MNDEQKTQPVEFVYYPAQAPVQLGRPRRGCGCLGRLFFGGLLILALLVFGGVAITGAFIYSGLSADIEDGIAALDSAQSRDTFETTQILDRNGKLLWEVFGEGKRTRIPLAKIPQELIDATVATEDDTFFENNGLDAPSVAAAIVANLRNPDERPQGASTITQQLVRHIAFEYEDRTAVNYSRKTKEILLAWLMNRKYAKDEILEMYLNEIYYGNLAYGVEAAAQTYFGKPATDLSLAESSLLAALPQSPVELDPLNNLDGAKQRQWLVLNLMVNERYISRTEAEAAYLAPLSFAAQEVSLQAPHFAVYVRQQLEEQFGPDLVANGGLRVTTSLDLDYQRLAEMLARQHVDSIDPANNVGNASLVAIKPGTGEILAMLGSLDYRDGSIDGNVNVALSPQQPGSAIKVLTYAAALSAQPEQDRRSWTAADILWDVPVEYPQLDGVVYEPVNYDRRFHGPVRLRDALANSYNVPAVLLLQDIGISSVLEMAGRLGISSFEHDPQRYGLSLTLGGGEVSPLELTSAYAVFANGGYRLPPVAILRVVDGEGTTLYEYQPPAPEPALDPGVAYMISDILDDDLARTPAMGRDNPLELSFPAAVKTGTSNEARDNWTVGYTPGLAVGVWAGNNDNGETLNVSGLTAAAPLWSAYMQAIYSDPELMAVLETNGARPPDDFRAPPGLEQRQICDLASVAPGATECALTDSEWFLASDSELAFETDPQKVRWEKVDPAVWRVPAVPLPPLPETFEIDFTEDRLPPQAFCHFEEGVGMDYLPADALASLFLSPPRNTESLIEAHRWAAENGLSILPAEPCTDELLAAARNSDILAIWRITSPKVGEQVNGVLPIVGTADFDPDKVQFYKLELGIGDPANPQWVTLGQVRDTPVVNGTLEMLHADALPAGDYLLRLIVIKWDGNYVGEPHTIQFTIE
ncbi:MAG: transglycosylase domain-containing protein [Chloroflexota bacterium]|nr:MAG: transglycosylase domain-containing protein [Chloroflexota bacterium]